MFLNTLVGISIFTILISGSSCIAQSKWNSSKVKGKSIYYEIRKSNESIFIRNSNQKGDTFSRRSYNPDVDELSNVRMTSHNAVLESFKEVFKMDRIKQLAESNDYVTIFVDVDENGLIINIRFALVKESSISPVEIEALETNLLKKMQFEVIGKRFVEPLFYSAPIRVSFSEVESGLIRMENIRENLKIPQ